MYSDGLKKVRYIKLLYKAFCSLFAWGLQTPREKGIWTISSQVLFLLPNKQLFYNKNRKGSTTRRVCIELLYLHIFPRMPEFNNKVFIKFRLNINTYKIIYL
jgi:hypothetical protein